MVAPAGSGLLDGQEGAVVSVVPVEVADSPGVAFVVKAFARFHNPVGQQHTVGRFQWAGRRFVDGLQQ